MITCVVEYEIDPTKIAAFEQFALRWMELVEAHGGHHHGYFLPAEGASDRALALFSFKSLAAYESYRSRFGTDVDFVEADRIRDATGCVRRHMRTFMRPLLPASPDLARSSRSERRADRERPGSGCDPADEAA
jgi:NIPSNAP protein